MSGFLESIRDNLEYLQDYQEVKATSGTGTEYKPWIYTDATQKQSDSFTNQVLQDIKDIQQPEESNTVKIVMVGGAVLLALLLLSKVKK